MFQLDIASLLTGDFSMNAIDCQARQLLDGLCHFRSFDAGENVCCAAVALL